MLFPQAGDHPGCSETAKQHSAYVYTSPVQVHTSVKGLMPSCIGFFSNYDSTLLLVCWCKWCSYY